ncbi:MAG: hypothetical protein KC900_09340 [Candidatus Omnitrophica bacterium]|nr:hypothetical protein [Candidatus Omnitrophota bacterium]
MHRRIRKVLFGLLTAVILFVQPALALDVYVTKNGKKYHKKDSRFIKGKEVEKLTREEAEARGYIPSREMIKLLEEMKQDDS